MRLINKKTQDPLVEFQGDKTIFFNKFLEQEMKQIGINVPPGIRSLYHGKDIVTLSDQDFQKAFKEIYYTSMMTEDSFQWIDD